MAEIDGMGLEQFYSVEKRDRRKNGLGKLLPVCGRSLGKWQKLEDSASAIQSPNHAASTIRPYQEHCVNKFTLPNPIL